MIYKIPRWLLGAVFVVFGLNGFFPFAPVPELAPAGQEFMNLLIASGYLYAVKLLEIAGGALLLARRSAAVGLVLLMPIVVNIALFHGLLDPGNRWTAAALVALTAATAWELRHELSAAAKGLLAPPPRDAARSSGPAN